MNPSVNKSPSNFTDYTFPNVCKSCKYSFSQVKKRTDDNFQVFDVNLGHVLAPYPSLPRSPCFGVLPNPSTGQQLSCPNSVNFYYQHHHHHHYCRASMRRQRSVCYPCERGTLADFSALFRNHFKISALAIIKNAGLDSEASS